MFRRVIFNSDTIGPSHRKARFDNALKGRRLPSRVIVYDPRFLDHVASPLHVERPERLGSVVARLQREGLFTEVTKAAPASLADLERVHRTPYLDLFRNLGERSEEHTSELQSRLHLVCRLLLEKKKNTIAS